MTLRILVLSATLLLLAACGQQASEEAAVTSDATPQPAALPHTAAADGASVFFITPADGDIVSNPVRIEFGIAAMDVVKAGNKQPNSGHHHLLIDTELPNLGLPIPADEQHVHFGDGSTTTEITLPPGEHKLQMLLGDYQHIPHTPPLVSEPITITVE